MPYWLPLLAQKPPLRWLPFVAVALLSVAIAAWAPLGRKPFQLDWSLSAAALSLSIQKPQHIVACAMLAPLAVLATGRRLPLAFVLVVLVGGLWELAQTTVIGHAARLADLLPDALAAIVGCLLAALLNSAPGKGARGQQADTPRLHRTRPPRDAR